MAIYDINPQELIRQQEAVALSLQLLPQAAGARIVSGAKDLVTGSQPTPANFGDGVKLFVDTVFGKAADPFYYRSKYGIGIYNYFIIKGESPSQSAKKNASIYSELSSYRTKYINTEGADYVPNTWEVLDEFGSVSEKSFPAIFVDSAIVSVSKRKDIVTTKIVNNSSSRKEYISDNDYDINISGVFATDDANIYPKEDVDALIRACEAPIVLDILCPYLYRFGITKMVVTGYDFPQEKGVYSTQRFSIKAKSHIQLYNEIGTSLLNNTQDKSGTQSALDSIANARTEIDNSIAEFFANR